MAAAPSSSTRHSTRRVQPVRRYGFDSDNSEDDSDNEDTTFDPPHITDESSSDTDSDGSEDLEASAEDGWTIIEPTDVSDATNFVFIGEWGWTDTEIDSTEFTVRDYIIKFLPDNLFETLTKWVNDRVLIENVRMMKSKKKCTGKMLLF